MFDKQKLDSQLMLDEGLKLKPYRDTRGFLTTGVGRNLDGNPLTPEEVAVIGHDGRTLPITHDQAIFLLHNDEMKAIAALNANAPWWSHLFDVRARVLIDLCFNMGWKKLSGFHNFLGNMQASNFVEAADDLKDSLWYGQVGNRGKRLVEMVRTGRDYTA